MIKQRTLANSISLKGITLHAGVESTVTLRPAPPDTGIIIKRADLNYAEIPALAANVTHTMLCTTLAFGDAHVATVEHVVSALAGLGIDNAYIETAGPEVPIMDGSAGPFVFAIQSAGISKQDSPKRFIRIKRPVKVQQDDKYAMLEPFDGFKINFTIDFNHPAISGRNQSASFNFSSTAYVKEVCRARTFGFMSQLQELRDKKLILGGSLDNAIVLDETGILNKGGLRSEDEFIKHKILDAIGDLYLAGSSLIGCFTAHKSGHGLNNALLRHLFAEENSDAWEYVTFEEPGATSPISYYKSALVASE